MTGSSARTLSALDQAAKGQGCYGDYRQFAVTLARVL
jgi:hypothetical protein